MPGARRTAGRALACLAVCFVGLLAADPFDMMLGNGMEALRRNDWAGAVEPLERASGLKPGDPRPWLGLARAWQKLGKIEASVEAAAKTAALGAGNEGFVRQGLAIYHAEGGRPQEAERWASLAEPELSTREQAALRFLLGGILHGTGNGPGAIPHLERALQLSPYEEQYHAGLGRALLVQQRFAEAAAALEASRRTFDASPQLELMLGVAYYAQRRFEDAVEAFLRTIRFAPDVPQPYVFLSKMLPQAESRMAEVAAALQKYGELRPEDPLGPYLGAMGLIARLAPVGDDERAAKAESLLRKSLAMKEDQADAHRELGLLLERRRAYAEAGRALERALELKPADSAIQYRLARIYDRLGQTERASAARDRHAALVAAEREGIDKHSGGDFPFEMDGKMTGGMQ